MAKTKTLIVTVLMFIMLAISLLLFWDDISVELGNWFSNFGAHHYTGVLLYGLSFGGLIYWMITVRRGWTSVPLMTFWFLITFVCGFLILLGVTEAGANAHLMLVQIFNEYMAVGDFGGALKPLAVMLTIPLAFVFFALGGFAFIAGKISDADPTGVAKTLTSGGGATTKQERHNRNQFKISNQRMKKKLGRK